MGLQPAAIISPGHGFWDQTTHKKMASIEGNGWEASFRPSLGNVDAQVVSTKIALTRSRTKDERRRRRLATS